VCASATTKDFLKIKYLPSFFISFSRFLLSLSLDYLSFSLSFFLSFFLSISFSDGATLEHNNIYNNNNRQI